MKNILNEKDLINITGGTGAAAESAKYSRDQKVRFFNPNDLSEELSGIIVSDPRVGDDGSVSYIIMVCNSEMEAQHMAGRRYNVSESNIIGLDA